MKNNLFYYATSELSQDAFLCYLMSFAWKDAKDDPILRACAKNFLQEMVPELSGKEFFLDDVERQVNHIDVLLTVICGEEKYKIVVEDKVYTSEHSNQLLRYLENLKDAYQGYTPKGVYYKTGFQSDLSAVIEANYKIIDRRRMLDLLAPYAAQTSNQIILDYFEYWNEFEQKAQSYQTLPLVQWEWQQVNAFYDAMKNSECFDKEQLWMDYGYVSNQVGGFDGLWVGMYNNTVTIQGVPCRLYLQVEAILRNKKYDFPICLKLEPLEETVPSGEIRNTAIFDEERNFRLTQYHFKKPGRLGSGKHMTIGVYDAAYTTADELQSALLCALDEYKRFISDLNKAQHD